MNSFDLFGNPILPKQIEEDPTYTAPHFVLATSELGESLEEEQQKPRSFVGLTLIILLVGVLLITQCFRLQILQGSANRALAEGNSLRIVTVQANRGLITDFSGKVLAQNGRQLGLAINPETLPAKKADREAVYTLLKKKAGINQTTINLIENNRLKSPDIFPIKTNLTKEEGLLYEEYFANTPGVVIQEIPIRLYTNFSSMGQLLGYVGVANQDEVSKGATPDQHVGKSGLEQTYDSILAGTPGKEIQVVNAAGEEVPDRPTTIESKPQDGVTLRLSLDSRLQDITAQALEDELARRNAKFGNLPQFGASAVILDPSTGAVKAMVSLPDYNGQLFAQGITQVQYQALLNDPGDPLLNRAIQGLYPSGSIIKPMIAAAALQDGIVSDSFKVVTPAAIYVGGYTFPDWKLHGLTDIRQAIAQSNDIFFYALGGGWPDKNIKGLGIEAMDNYLNKFGLGNVTGVDLPGESAGLIPTPDWKEKNIKEPWYIGDTYHSAIGQGYTLVTPLQMAVATAAVVNGGTVWQPSLAWSTIDPSTGKETLLPHKALAKDFISPQNLEVVREGMRQTVLAGSATPLKTLTVTSAGKTGTAEFGTENQTHAWYTGFAPYENPQLVFAINIEDGGDSFYSSVPVAEEILRGYFNDPLKPGQQLNSATEVPAGFQGEH